MAKISYRGWYIEFNPKPIPASCGVDWDYWHPDIDLDDTRCGQAASELACRNAIDEWIEEYE
jgi:hypothetical protein